MQFKIIILLFSGIIGKYVLAETENSVEVPRGRYPYMAFLYYQDSSILEENSGNRFFRSAVIISPSWLLSAAIDPPIKDDKILGFPDKTLLARAGAIVINSQISMNEDDYEQEQEIVELIRPTNHSKLMFWKSDITLLKTVNPFKITKEVAAAPLSPFRFAEKECSVLMYVKETPTTSDDKKLLRFSVIVQKSNSKNCGSHFHEPTMICAADSENMQSVNYCEGNSGGPIVCEKTVVGLQTYIEDNCKPPHMYQQLSKWETFIKCGTEGNCSDNRCSKVCKSTNKDKREAKVEAESSEEEASEENEINMRASDETETTTNVTDSGMSTTENSDTDVVSTTTLTTVVAASNEKGESTTLTKVIEEEIAPEQKVSTASSEPEAEVTTPMTTDDAVTKVARKSWFEQYKNKDVTPSPTTLSTADLVTAPMTKSTKAVAKVHHRSRQVRRRNSASKMGIIRELVIVVSILLCAL